jgi:hypothetical protein
LAREFRLAEDLLYLIGDSFEIRIYNATTRAAPVLLSIIDLGGSAIKPFICQNYGYIANGFGGFYILNLSDNGEIVYHYDQLGENVRDIWVSEQIIICSMESGYLKIFNNTIKDNPILLSEHFIDEKNLWDLQVCGNYLFAINNDNNFTIVDISDPNTPITTAILSINPSEYRQLQGFTLKDNFAFVLEPTTTSIVVIDHTNKSAPAIIARNNINTLAFDIEIREDYAYITSLVDSALVVLDISNINSFTKYDTIAHSELPFYLFLSNENILYLTSFNNLSIFDCRNPSSPILVNSYAGYWVRTYEMNNYLLAAKGTEGFSLYAATITLPRTVYKISLPFYSFLFVLTISSIAIIYHRKKKLPKK